MKNEFSGIEKRLDELDVRLARLRPLRTESREAFDEDPYLRDINVLVHEYVQLDWDRVYRNLQQLDDLEEYATRIRVWLHEKGHTDA